MKKILLIFLTAVVSLVFLYFVFIPSGRAVWNNYTHTIQKVDDDTLYKTRKLVEDTARASISNYTVDKLMYEQYKDSESAEKREWAEQAKMRANRTASTYNNYILKNSYVFKNNVPSDIVNELKYID